MSTNIDIIIVVLFLIANLLVGFYHGREVKTVKDHALGGGNFSTASIVATLVATLISGSGFFIMLSRAYSDGIRFVAISSSMALILLIMAFVFIPKMKRFLGKTSIAEVMGNLYGKNVRIIIAIAGGIGAAGGIAVQLKVFGGVFHYFLGIDAIYSILIASAIITVYSSFGGIKAVTSTDILQFFTFGFVIPCVGTIIWNQLNSSGINALDGFDKPLFDYKTILNIGNPDFWQMIPLMLYFAIPPMSQDLFQRISIGKNIQQVQKAFIIAAILVLIVKLSIAWIPFLIYNVDPNLDPNNLVTYIADNYSYTGLKGLIIIGVLAMSMSTADSDMNAASVLFSNDFCKPLKIGVNKELLLLRAFSFALGGIAVLLALTKKDLLSIVLMANSFYMPVVTVPIMLTVLGFKTTTKSVYIGMGAGFATVVIWNIMQIETDCIIFAMIINLIFLLGSHYLLKQSGGWTKIESETPLRSSKLKRKTLGVLKAVKEFNFMEFCKNNSPRNELTYMGLGIYCIFYTFTTIYSTQVELLKDNGKVVLIIYQIMLCTSVLLAMYPIWPLSIKKEIKEKIIRVLWNIIIFYMLIFFSGFFVMVNNFGQLQFVVFTLNIVTTALLVGWKIGLIMSIGGFYLSIIFYKFYAGIDSLDVSINSPHFILMYSLMLIVSTLIIFLKPKEELQAITEEKNEHLTGRIGAQEEQVRKALGLREEFIRNVQHEYNTPMTGILSMADALKGAYHHLSDERRLTAIDDIFKSAAQLKVYDENILTLARLSKKDYKLSKENLDFSNLVYDRIETCRRLYEEDKGYREFILNIQEGITIKGDRCYLTQVLDNLIINAISYCEEGVIKITLTQDKDNAEFTIIDEGLGIPPEELRSIFGEFMVSSKTHSYAGGRGVGLALARRVIEVHGGDIHAESDGRKGAKFTFVLPKNKKRR